MTERPPATLFYVVAFQRSGTTLLSYLLDAHPDVLCVNEFELAKHVVYRRPDRLVDPGNVELRQILAHYGADWSTYVELARRYRDGAIEAGSFLTAAYELCNRKGALVIGSKEVCDLVAYDHDFVKKLLRLHRDGLKVVFIERDIKGVVASFVKLGYVPPARQAVTDRVIERFARRYVRVLNYIEWQLARGADLARIRYEALVTEPARVLGGVLAFLGVDASEETVTEMLARPGRSTKLDFAGTRSELAEDWRRVLPPEQVRTLDEIYAAGRR